MILSMEKMMGAISKLSSLLDVLLRFFKCPRFPKPHVRKSVIMFPIMLMVHLSVHVSQNLGLHVYITCIM